MEKMKAKEILAIGILVILVCSVGLVIAQENHVKSNNGLAEILDEHGMIQNPETGLFEVKTEGGIPEAGLSEAELKEMIEESNLENFRDRVTGKINYTKLANFTDPVTEIISRLKERGYNDIEITEILEKHGMGWYPETGATYIGIGPTEEELKHLAPLYNPTDSETYSKSLHQANQVMEVKNDIYRGIDNMMCSGSCAVKEGETFQHVVTTHLGRGGHWTEAGVVRTVSNTNWRIFSYDDDEGTWDWHGTTSATTYNDYNIQVIGPHGGSYRYGIWINGAWQRYGHLPYKENDVNQANEVWSYTNKYTSDTIAAYHKEPHLYVGYNQLIWWNEEVSTKWWRNFWPPWPVKEDHWMGTHAWIYKTWVE
ncbi:MAG TPA: hypothetical protein HA348_06400 [Thermoplasmata archaeon]|nr:hypothetical protein [Thermoplasmata archaeon]